MYSIQTYEVIALISEENAKVLAFFVQHAEDGVPEDRIPEWIDGRRIADLYANKLLERRTVVPPGKEPLYPRGLSAYAIPPVGKDALFEYQRTRQQKAEDKAADNAEKNRMAMERRRDIRRDYVLFALGLLAGWILGCFTPIDAWNWLSGLFH